MTFIKLNTPVTFPHETTAKSFPTLIKVEEIVEIHKYHGMVATFKKVRNEDFETAHLGETKIEQGEPRWFADATLIVTKYTQRVVLHKYEEVVGLVEEALNHVITRKDS